MGVSPSTVLLESPWELSGSCKHVCVWVLSPRDPVHQLASEKCRACFQGRLVTSVLGLVGSCPHFLGWLLPGGLCPASPHFRSAPHCVREVLARYMSEAAL